MKLTTSTLQFAPRSLLARNGIEYGLAITESVRALAILAPSGCREIDAFEGNRSTLDTDTLLLGPLNAHNAGTLRNQLPYLQPCLLKLKTSAGMGDRMGLATPGHVRAARYARGKIAPIFAQQSMREMARTERTPQMVMDDATWGMFEEGWQEGAGADADHLKTTDDIDACLASGYTFFTFDPGAYVDNRAGTASLSELRELADLLPDEVRSPASGLAGRYFRFDGASFKFDEATLMKATVKYGKAIAHVSHMYHYLIEKAGTHPVEVEVSVDETEQPTSHAEHVYIASELRRLGVRWVSLAPRYVGRFEKGVDYIGDIEALEVDIIGHAEIARQFGPYKLSLHSGSDKFSVYPIVVKHTQGLVHLKTAGTSYLEALRTIAVLDPALFKEIYTYAYDHYETDRQTYHVSASLDRAPKPNEVIDLPILLDQFDSREILHVTFGSVLTERMPDGQLRFSPRLFHQLRENPEMYALNLERHFIRHLKPFIR